MSAIASPDAPDPALCTWGDAPHNTGAPDPASGTLEEAQQRWAATPLADRLAILRRARHRIAANPLPFTQALAHLPRTPADTLVAELLPLLDAIRFLERRAPSLLAPQKLGARHRPLWLTGVQAEVHHEPLGHILVIGPANFPLFLPGVQTLQALAAGNAVTWKPGAGGQPAAQLLAQALQQAGLPQGILHITDESVAAAQTALAQSPDKVLFTGSHTTAPTLLHTLAATATPATLELSGADAVLVLPSADLALTAAAIAFGLRLNGAQVCMSPRRLLATHETLTRLLPHLLAELAKLPPVNLPPQTAATLQTLFQEAQSQGAQLLPTSNPTISPLEPQQNPHPSQLQTSSLIAEQLPSKLPNSEPETQQKPSTLSSSTTHPIILQHATPQMAITRTPLFAPVLSLIEAPSVLHLAPLANDNPFGLTAAIFGSPREATALAAQLRAGTVLLNDLIAPTADPRLPFGGRGRSGYGLTRGAQGLLELTASKVILRRRRPLTRHYAPLTPADTPRFTALLGLLHAPTLRQRLRSLRNLIAPKSPQTPPHNAPTQDSL